MHPGDVEFGERERRGLGVGGVGLGGFVEVDAAGGVDFRRPKEIERPADEVEHVGAHVTDDAVAVFREGAPTAGMGERIVRPHGGGAQGNCGAGALSRSF